MLRLIGEQIEHAVASPRPHTEDSLEFISCGPVDCEPAILEVGDLDERTSALHDVGEDLALGERVGDAALERLVQVSEPPLGKHPLHFDEVYSRSNSFQKTRVVYGGLVLAWTLALGSRDLCGNALWDLGLRDGAHPNPTLAGDTICAAAKVIVVGTPDSGAGAVALRLVGLKNQTAQEAYAAHGDALFEPEIDKPKEQKIASKVVEVTRTLYLPRRP